MSQTNVLNDIGKEPTKLSSVIPYLSQVYYGTAYDRPATIWNFDFLKNTNPYFDCRGISKQCCKVFLLEDDEERIRFFNKYLDDFRFGFYYEKASNSGIASNLLKFNADILFFDYDLFVDEEERNGYDILDFITETPGIFDMYKNKLFVIHSLNVTGSLQMFHLLKIRGYENVVIFPYPFLKNHMELVIKK